ncbi:hypothetical protein [Haladaptatus sp.]|uniref:hypothetical protein n=1 Tax=Haladaptatus sp. TaxID=1973141 RepID=UPI003C3E345D
MSRDEQVHGTEIDRVGSDSPPDDSITALGLLVGALRDIRSRPSLAVPFLVTSIVLAACNIVRLRDPVVTQVATVARAGLAHFVVLLYPGDTSLVTRPIGAILGLRLPIMAEVAAVWLVTQIAIATAVVALVTRSDGDSVSVRSVASLVVFQCCLSGLVWAVGAMLGFVVLLVGVLLVRSSRPDCSPSRCCWFAGGRWGRRFGEATTRSPGTHCRSSSLRESSGRSSTGSGAFRCSTRSPRTVDPNSTSRSGRFSECLSSPRWEFSARYV